MKTIVNYDAYQIFADKAVNEYRFVLDEESGEFQSMIKETAEKRKLISCHEQRLYRARKGYDGIVNKLFQPHPIKSMLAPPPDKAREGRVNPKGIPCFYAADQLKTAVMELRPWIGEIISVAIFQPNKPLQLVDITNDDEQSITLKKCLGNDLPATETEIEKQIWSEINDAFSKPITIDDETAKYAPTQIISEWLKSWGYHGVIYKSSVHPKGKNYAFFDANLFSESNEGGLSRVVTVSEIDLKHPPANTVLTVSQHKNGDQ